MDRGYGNYEGYEKLLYPWIYQWIYADVDRKTINEYRPDIRELGKRCSIVIIDEAHGAMGDSTGFVLNSLGFNFQRKTEVHPNHVRLLGLTATPFKNPAKERNAGDESDSGKRVYSATEKLQSRFGNNFLMLRARRHSSSYKR